MSTSTLRSSTTRITGAIAAALVAAATFGVQATTMDSPLAQPDRTRLASPAPAVGDFALTDHEGRPARLSNFRGGMVLVFFGFTHCQSVCPAAMQKMRQVRRALAGEEAAPVNVLISVDGERDSPEVMKAFLEPLGAGFVGLTGEPSQVRPMADGFSAVFFKGGQTGADGGYDVEHTSQVYLVDRRGRLRATFYNAPAEDMVAVILGVMRE